MLDEKRRALLFSLAKDRTNSPAVICATLGISRSSFYRYLSGGQRGTIEAVDHRHDRDAGVADIMI